MSIERTVIGTKYIQQDAADFDSLNIGEQFEYNDEPYIKIACYNGLPAAFCYTTGKIAWFPFETKVIRKTFHINIIWEELIHWIELLELNIPLILIRFSFTIYLLERSLNIAANLILRLVHRKTMPHFVILLVK